jgi:hypothetical protein
MTRRSLGRESLGRHSGAWARVRCWDLRKGPSCPAVLPWGFPLEWCDLMAKNPWGDSLASSRNSSQGRLGTMVASNPCRRRLRMTLQGEQLLDGCRFLWYSSYPWTHFICPDGSRSPVRIRRPRSRWSLSRPHLGRNPFGPGAYPARGIRSNFYFSTVDEYGLPAT